MKKGVCCTVNEISAWYINMMQGQVLYHSSWTLYPGSIIQDISSVVTSIPSSRSASSLSRIIRFQGVSNWSLKKVKYNFLSKALASTIMDILYHSSICVLVIFFSNSVQWFLWHFNLLMLRDVHLSPLSGSFSVRPVLLLKLYLLYIIIHITCVDYYSLYFSLHTENEQMFCKCIKYNPCLPHWLLERIREH